MQKQGGGNGAYVILLGGGGKSNQGKIKRDATLERQTGLRLRVVSLGQKNKKKIGKERFKGVETTTRERYLFTFARKVSREGIENSSFWQPVKTRTEHKRV